MGRTHKKYLRGLYDGQKSVSEIIRSSVTSKADLEKLAQKLDLENVNFCWIDDYLPTMKNAICNIDSDHIGGTHWVSIYDNEYYFDSLGLPIARDKLNYLQYTTLPVQNYKFGGCGSYAVLWLYYANMNEIDKFYSLFNI